MVQVVKHCGGQIGFDMRIVEAKVNAGKLELMALAEVKDCYLGILLLLGAD
jgi:hypothetical protein